MVYYMYIGSLTYLGETNGRIHHWSLFIVGLLRLPVLEMESTGSKGASCLNLPNRLRSHLLL
jgi:hypothetical protein